MEMEEQVQDFRALLHIVLGVLIMKAFAFCKE